MVESGGRNPRRALVKPKSKEEIAVKSRTSSTFILRSLLDELQIEGTPHNSGSLQVKAKIPIVAIEGFLKKSKLQMLSITRLPMTAATKTSEEKDSCLKV